VIVLSPSSGSARLIVLDQHQADYYERAGGAPEMSLIRWVAEWIPKGKAFLDVGAHCGTYALNLAPLLSARVHAFEPQPSTFHQLCGGIALNDLSDRVTAVRTAVSDACGEQVLRAVSTDGGGSSIVSDAIERRRVLSTHVVRTTSLDAYAGSKDRLGPVGLVKIDVEGAERLVLEGALGLLRAHRPTVLLESWAPARSTRAADERRAVCELLEGLGYAIRPVTDCDEMLIAGPR
jgi:FkbM family methyltransferase